MAKWLLRFVRDEEGQDMTEYAFLVAFIALVAVLGANALGIGLDTFYDNIAGAVQGLTVPSP